LWSKGLSVVKPSISFLGAGRLARALAPALKLRGYTIDEIVVRNRVKSRKAALALAFSVSATAETVAQSVLDSAVIWFCVPDDAITPLASELAISHDWAGKIAFHSSGALPSSALAALRSRGAVVASVHPMMTFAETSVPLPPGVAFGVEGDANAVSMANRIVKDLRGIKISLRESDKTFYHLMATFSSPLVVALLAGAEQLGRAAHLSPARTKRAIGPLLEATVQNYLRDGLTGAFTGPVRRGDITTLKNHLAALNSRPILRDAYCALLDLATHELPARRAKEIQSLLRVRKTKGRPGKG